MSREPAQPATLSDAAFLRLRADIMSGRLKPGAKLKIGVLVEHYRVGASPTREALARLSSDHLVVLRGNRGFSVAPVSREDLFDLVRARCLIEAEAVALAIELGDVEWETRIVAAYYRQQQAHRQSAAEGFAWSQAWEDSNHEFHDAICSGCASVWLLRMQQQLYAQSERYRRIALDRSPVPRDGDAEHKAIMDACLGRDAALARKLTIQHIERTATIVADIIPSGRAAEHATSARVMRVLEAGDPARMGKAPLMGRERPPGAGTARRKSTTGGRKRLPRRGKD